MANSTLQIYSQHGVPDGTTMSVVDVTGIWDVAKDPLPAETTNAASAAGAVAFTGLVAGKRYIAKGASKTIQFAAGTVSALAADPTKGHPITRRGGVKVLT